MGSKLATLLKQSLMKRTNLYVVYGDFHDGTIDILDTFSTYDEALKALEEQVQTLLDQDKEKSIIKVLRFPIFDRVNITKMMVVTLEYDDSSFVTIKTQLVKIYLPITKPIEENVV